MIEYLIIYCLAAFSIFYLINYSEILEKQRKIIVAFFPDWLSYMIQCGFCFCFWLSIILYFLIGLQLWIVFTAPAFMMFMNLTFQILVKYNDK